jgi:uncharacterized repeat protein (TIGR03803 family)
MADTKRLFAWNVLLGIIVAFGFIHACPMQGQTFTVLHDFTGRVDGSTPSVGLAIDRGGNLYGTTNAGGSTGNNCLPSGCGVVFKLSQRTSGWILTPLVTFEGGSDGIEPQTQLVIGSNGSLYGATFSGGGASWCGAPGCGTSFFSRPSAHTSANTLGAWKETQLHVFTAVPDGSHPGYGALFFDQSGNAYGTTIGGGATNYGTVYELTPSIGGWTEQVIYRFSDGLEGGFPYGGVVGDSAGNLYGTTIAGGTNDVGTVYQLTPTESGWTGTVLYSFTGGNDGETPIGNLIIDASGNLYGTASEGGLNGGGTVFELSPSENGWTFTLLYGLTGDPNGSAGPWGGLTTDAAGNLYGTTGYDGPLSQGSVFELERSSDGWNYIDLYDFQGTVNDGAHPYGNVTQDSNGNLFGTATAGGAYGHGVVWEISRGNDLKR